jgi:hypothetical protein
MVPLHLSHFFSPTFANQNALCEFDRLAALWAQNLLIECVRKDFYFLRTLWTNAKKRLKFFNLIKLWQLMWCGHNILLS